MKHPDANKPHPFAPFAAKKIMVVGEVKKATKKKGK